jgi:hypothetical protein
MNYLDGRSLVPQVVLDVGANVGFFSLSFAERGAIAYAVEAEALNERIGRIASNSLGESAGTFVPIRLWCRQETVGSLPDSNITLCLSIWHHWVRNLGLDNASLILAQLVRKTSDALFFDTGENEMPADYNLPFRGQDAKAWLTDYLNDFDSVLNVKCLGTFTAFVPNSDEKCGDVRRHLFVIEKS